jgi:alkanesulfonate monooxygenase SsuD/methylene tetrahydromethanopterin reductase-like flavin-dependent oxidoreductase (luciferase family)
MPADFGLALDFATGRAPLGQVLDELTPPLRRAERLGFASVVAGQTFPSRAGAFHLASPLLVLAALAPRTSLRLGTGVTLQPVWQPLNLAYDGAILDQICGGRLFLGISVGNPHDWQIFGLERETVGQRFDELLDAVKALWSGQPGFEGQLLRVSQGIHPLPLQAGGPPILIGGLSPRAARRAAAYADGYYAATQYRREDVARQIDRYREALDAAGKPSEHPLVAINRLTFVAESREQALKEGREYVAGVLRRYARMNALSGLQADDPELFEHALESICLVGTPETVAAQIEQYVAAGVTSFQLRVAPADMPLELAERTITLVGEQLIPCFR